MFIATAVVSSLMALALIASARGKLVKDPQVMKIMTRVGVPEDKLWLLAAAEIAGAIGLVAGLLWWPIGVAAAVGIIPYFLGAVGSHLRVKDRNITASGTLLVIAATALTLRTLSI
jgi:uncharacterized membrane protein YphA (DoxX/SURF4 family)